MKTVIGTDHVAFGRITYHATLTHLSHIIDLWCTIMTEQRAMTSDADIGSICPSAEVVLECSRSYILLF